MSTFYGQCVKCREPVVSPQTPAFRVEGFEVPREQGGTNHIVNRERVPNLVWHSTCIPSSTSDQGQMEL